jgi:three-Cys-motif partner protein
LRFRTSSHHPAPTIIEGDCNDSATIAAIRKAVPSNTLGIVFVDNVGWDVNLNTISRVVADRKMDLIVTFQVSALKRNVSRALNEPKIGAQWDRFLGVGWQKVVADFEARKIQAPDVGAALGDYYADRLLKIGYRYGCPLNDTMRNTRNAPLYRIMSFSKHPLGQRLFRAVSKSVDAPSFNFDR